MDPQTPGIPSADRPRAEIGTIGGWRGHTRETERNAAGVPHKNAVLVEATHLLSAIRLPISAW